jgi:hypothetical protein
MRNFLNFLAAAFLLVLLLTAQLYPASPLFWVASLSPMFTVLRCALVFVLLWFIIHPPKSKVFRVPLGSATLVLAYWLADTTYQGSLGFMDFLTLAIATVALLTTLLESKPKDEEFKSMRVIAAMSNWVSERIQVATSWIYQFGWLVLTDFDLALGSYYRSIRSTRSEQAYGGSSVPTRTGGWNSNLRAGLMH